MITTTQQSIAVTGVTDVTLTAAEQDADSGDWIREIRVSGSPVTEGGAPLVFTLRLVSEQKAQIDLTAPEQAF